MTGLSLQVNFLSLHLVQKSPVRSPEAAGESIEMTNGNQVSAALDIAVLVFREGLESILVLTAVTASFKGRETKYNRPVAVGVATAFLATLLTWNIAVRLDDIGKNLSALAVQAATGLLAILVLLVVMNWFFHKLYWTGWISVHNQRKRELLSDEGKARGELRVLWGMALLGFTSFYREGFEVVLFLQSYRLKLGDLIVLTFVAHRHLPYRRMLVLTGLMLAFVLVVMGEEAQEMQLAHWLPVTKIPRLAHVIPSWMGLWFSISQPSRLYALKVLLRFSSLGPTSRRVLRPGSPVDSYIADCDLRRLEPCFALRLQALHSRTQHLSVHAAVTKILASFRDLGFLRITISTSRSSAVIKFINRSTENPSRR